MVFQGLPMAFNADATRGLHASYRFDITGAGGEPGWSRSTMHVRIGEGPAPFDWRFELDTET